ncbi:MAG TPA: serine hydrolase domain-containing protein [Gemmatimonadales bacterium]|nr:serine hydrolase domain-containing protein [Gemmatimonadales bacterium]
MRSRALLALCLAATACEPAMDERQTDRSERVRSYLQTLVSRSRAPGIQYLVVDSTSTLFEYDGGWADVGRRVPMDSTTTLMAYSMSKTITAAAVLRLVGAGRVGLDDPVTRYVDSIPYGDGITVRQLLAHLSGIPNPIPLRWVHLAAAHAGFDESAALAAVLREHPKLKSPPGAKYAYSNIGYWLLSPVVGRASGQPFTAYVADQVLSPLGITPPELGYTIPDPAHHATGYLKKYSFMNLAKRLLIDREYIGRYEGPWLSIASHYPNGPAFGGLVGTARGFGKFLRDELGPHSVLFDDQTRRLLFEPQRTTGGATVAMTLGWHVGDLGGVRFFYKEGGGGGYHHMMRVYPSAGIATVVMSNATGFDARGCLDVADREFLN